jgi:hypothetical protein
MSSSWVMVINCRYQRYAVFVRWALSNECPLLASTPDRATLSTGFLHRCDGLAAFVDVPCRL